MDFWFSMMVVRTPWSPVRRPANPFADPMWGKLTRRPVRTPVNPFADPGGKLDMCAFRGSPVNPFCASCIFGGRVSKSYP